MESFHVAEIEWYDLNLNNQRMYPFFLSRKEEGRALLCIARAFKCGSLRKYNVKIRQIRHRACIFRQIKGSDVFHMNYLCENS